jgi:L-fucose isomerase-like protein
MIMNNNVEVYIMLNHNLKIGLVPMRRNTTNRPAKTFLTWVSAEDRGERFVKYIEENFASENISFVDTKGLGSNNLIFDDESAKACAERFKNENVDAIMIINCNFGNEEAACDLAKMVGKPCVLWAPLDDEYYVDGMRPTDSQCGLFGVSRQFQRYGVPFSHIPCCRVESDEFKEGFTSFTRVACMVKNFTDLRIGQVGARPAPFFSVIWNEGELMQKFGVRITPVNFAILQDRYNKNMSEKKDEIAKFVQMFRDNYKMDELTPNYLERMACLCVTYIGLFEEFKLDIISAECWTATPVMFDGLAPCAVYGILNDMGYMIVCESDIHCALTMVLLESAAFGKKRPFLGEFTVRHPENKNAELLWHCGPFPLSVKAPDSTARLVNQREWFRGKDGTYTLARIDQESGNYMILAGTCKTVKGPETHGTYIWGEFDDLQKWEDRLLDGPYIHHFVEVEGDYVKELREFTKYFKNLNIDKTID